MQRDIYQYKNDPESSHRQMARLVNERRGKKVLDAGCGGGFLGRAIGKNGVKIWGLDKDTNWKNSRWLSTYKYVLWEDLERKGWEKELKNEEFDGIVAADVLEHLDNPEKVVKKLWKKVRKGGWMLVSLPNCEFWPVWLVRRLWPGFKMSRGPLDRTHKHFYGRLEAEKMLNGANAVKLVAATPPPFGLVDRMFGQGKPMFWIYNFFAVLARKWPRRMAYQLIFEVT